MCVQPSRSESFNLLSQPSSNLCHLFCAKPQRKEFKRFLSKTQADLIMDMSSPTPLPPGFRFHPTDEELILHYLKNRAASLPIPVSIIAEVDIYKFDPWELPAQATFGDREWYFFSPRDRKYPNGIRPNRAAASGYWKATGTDKPIHTATGKGKENIGIKKALVFYKGRPPKGIKTNWIMHEYRLAVAHSSNNYKPMKFRDTSMRLDDWVLCRIYKKNSHVQPMPALLDREQEEYSSAEDIYSTSFRSSEQRSTAPGLQKTISISDFLEDYSAVANLLENPPQLAAPEHSSFVAHPNLSLMATAVNSSSNGSKMQLGARPELIAENNMKRQRLNDDDNYIYGANFSNQFGSSQCSLLNQSFFDQQLLNSQLGLH